MDLSSLTDGDRVQLMEQAFSAVDEVCSQLGDTEWDLPTDCPAWTVKDNLSHLASFEAIATGTAVRSDVDVSHLSHVTGDAFAEMNEREVEARRLLPGPQILDEFRDATAKRIKQLSGLDEAGWETEIPSPVGNLHQRNFLSIRILDVFYHEQDMRRATSRPGHLDGEVARFVFERMATVALTRITGKNAPEGARVVYDIAAPGRPVGISVREGKGILETIDDPSIRLSMDFEAFFMLLGGRKKPKELHDAGRLAFEGDPAVVHDILANINVVP